MKNLFNRKSQLCFSKKNHLYIQTAQDLWGISWRRFPNVFSPVKIYAVWDISVSYKCNIFLSTLY